MLDERNRKILFAIVQSYISCPEPVGSRYISKKYYSGLSSATIRNIMADLEESGYLHQPHTSAGRIPTDRGYRFFVNSLIENETCDKNLLHELTEKLKALKKDTDILFAETVKTLSVFSHYIGVVLPPKSGRSVLNRLELLKYKGTKIVAILFTNEGIIKNKVLNMGAEFTQKDLSRISDYINTQFYGCNLDDIRLNVLKELTKEKILCDTIISKAINICKEALCFSDSDIFIAGFSDVLGLPDFSSFVAIKKLSQAIEEKHVIIRMLEKLSVSDKVQVLIGSENQNQQLNGLSMVAASYMEGDKKLGSVGIIGPTRMDYIRTMTIVETTAKHITRVLSER